MGILDERKIDCHCHVIDPDRFPYAADTRYRPSGQEIAPVDQLLRMLRLCRVEHALIVGTHSAYGEDLSPVLDAIERGDGRFKGMAVVANDVAAQTLVRLKASGMVGVAFNTIYESPGHYARTDDLLRKLADLDMYLQIQCKEDQLLELVPLIEHSTVRLLIDHCGRPRPERGLDQPGFRALLALGRAGRATVKLSGFSQFSRERYPWRDAHPFVHALLGAFTADACVWGSDWPFLRATGRIDYAPLLVLFECLVARETDRRKLLWDTPRRLFGFAT
ncbi:MAG: amidohydrolase family protein [Acetobacteraceae bacterium]